MTYEGLPLLSQASQYVRQPCEPLKSLAQSFCGHQYGKVTPSAVRALADTQKTKQITVEPLLSDHLGRVTIRLDDRSGWIKVKLNNSRLALS